MAANCLYLGSQSPTARRLRLKHSSSLQRSFLYICSDRVIRGLVHTSEMLSKCPFLQKYELDSYDGSLDVPEQRASEDGQPSTAPQSNAPAALHVPGQPTCCLSDIQSIITFLEQDLLTLELDTMAPYLWMMSTQSSGNIKPLHRQLVKGRKVVVTEDPRLHLVWLQDTIFIKPLPKYLTSHSFWTNVLLSDPPVLGARQDRIARAALGYLRTYRYLIQHESDLSIAQQENTLLIPKTVDWQKMCCFGAGLDVISNGDVTPRYRFGELRLSRLNFYAKFILGKFHYERLHVQYGSYFSQFYGPLLFVFAIFSLVLSALQAELAAEQLQRDSRVTLHAFGQWFSIGAMVWLAFICTVLSIVFLYMFVDEWLYAIRHRIKQKRWQSRLCVKNLELE